MKIETTTRQTQVVNQEAEMANTATEPSVDFGYSDAELAEAAAQGVHLEEIDGESNGFGVGGYYIDDEWDEIEPEFFEVECFAGVSL